MQKLTASTFVERRVHIALSLLKLSAKIYKIFGIEQSNQTTNEMIIIFILH